MCHTILHRNNDDKSCLEVAFTSPLEISRVLFVVRFLVGWFGFFFWGGWRLVCLTFFNRGCYNDSAPVSSMVCKQLNQYCWGMAQVGNSGWEGTLSEAGVAFPKSMPCDPFWGTIILVTQLFHFWQSADTVICLAKTGGEKTKPTPNHVIISAFCQTLSF